MNSAKIVLISSLCGSFLIAQEQLQRKLEIISEGPDAVLVDNIREWFNELKEHNLTISDVTVEPHDDTLLHLLVRGKNTACLEYLLRNQVIDCANKQGKTARELAYDLYQANRSAIEKRSSQKTDTVYLQDYRDILILLNDYVLVTLVRNYLYNSTTSSNELELFLNTTTDLRSDIYEVFPSSTKPTRSLGQFLESYDSSLYCNLNTIYALLKPGKEFHAAQLTQKERELHVAQIFCEYMQLNTTSNFEKLKMVFTACPISIEYIALRDDIREGIELDRNLSIPRRDELLKLVGPHRKIDLSLERTLDMPGETFMHYVFTCLISDDAAKESQLVCCAQQTKEFEPFVREILVADIFLTSDTPTTFLHFMQWLSPRLFPRKDIIGKKMGIPVNHPSSSDTVSYDRHQLELLKEASLKNSSLSPLAAEASKNFKELYERQRTGIDSSTGETPAANTAVHSDATPIDNSKNSKESLLKNNSSETHDRTLDTEKPKSGWSPVTIFQASLLGIGIVGITLYALKSKSHTRSLLTQAIEESLFSSVDSLPQK